jgi:hypothetical protein
MPPATPTASPGNTVLSGTVLAGAGLVAATTVAGAWLARHQPGHRQIWFAAAAGALLIIAGLHLLPDAWAGARAAGIWLPLVPIAAVAGFTAARLASRAGCGCREHRQQASGAGTAAALTAHRFLEGSALALAGSVAGWLALMCLSPVIGAAVTDAFPVPEAAEPVLVAVAAGVLGQAAWVSLSAAFRGLRPTRLLLSAPATATTTAAVVTVLAVRGIGLAPARAGQRRAAKTDIDPVWNVLPT